jgi:hypothetical protein
MAYPVCFSAIGFSLLQYGFVCLSIDVLCGNIFETNPLQKTMEILVGMAAELDRLYYKGI